MSALGVAFLVLSPRSDTVAGLSGPGRDERWAAIDVHATATSGLVLVTVILGAFFYELATGRDGEPWSQLGAVGGVAYVVSVLILRRRADEAPPSRRALDPSASPQRHLIARR
jgi:hypothetical protein